MLGTLGQPGHRFAATGVVNSKPLWATVGCQAEGSQLAWEAGSRAGQTVMVLTINTNGIGALHYIN